MGAQAALPLTALVVARSCRIPTPRDTRSVPLYSFFIATTREANQTVLDNGYKQGAESPHLTRLRVIRLRSLLSVCVWGPYLPLLLISAVSSGERREKTVCGPDFTLYSWY